MALTKFRPINYQTVDYTDDPGGMKAFKESYDNAKNVAVEAMDKKKSEFMQTEIDRLENKMLPPKGSKMIVDDGKGGKQVNKGFYAMMNLRPEDAFRQARQRAEDAGLGKHAINRSEFMEQFKGLMDTGVKRQYQGLSEYGAKNGMSNLDSILDKEGGQFTAFYQRYTDPYTEFSDKGLLPTHQAALPKGSFKSPGGFTLSADGSKVVSGPIWGNIHGIFPGGEKIWEDEFGVRWIDTWQGPVAVDAGYTEYLSYRAGFPTATSEELAKRAKKKYK